MRMRPAKMSFLATVFLLIGAIAFFSIGAQAETPAPDPNKGATVYASNCAPCHGKQGEGNVGIPNLAGAAGHIQQLGIPPDKAIPGFIRLLRDGIPGNMPGFPPEVLSDGDIGDLGAYMFTVPAPSGAAVYTANCALCHGLKGEGKIGPPLAGAAEKFEKMGMTKEQIAQLMAGFPTLVRKGIPGKMPANPQMSDVEISRLIEYLVGLPAPDSWEAEFESKHGYKPTDADKADRAWSLQFYAQKGRAPSDAEWVTYWRETHK